MNPTMTTNISNIAIKTIEGEDQKISDYAGHVMGFPCNDFGAQEPDTNDKIADFCDRTYGVTFDLFDKVTILGGDKHPLYAALTTAVEPAGDVKWNFEKFLVDRKGNVVGRYPSSTTPEALGTIVSAALAG
jgi:glutathione peroxidase